MTTKTITIMEDVYRLLKVRKREGESFSEALRRVLSRKRDIMQFAGAWKSVSDEEAERMKEKMKEVSRKSTNSLVRRFGYKGA